MLLEFGADPNLSNSSYGTALTIATYPHIMDEEMVEILTRFGASDKRAVSYTSPLFISLQYKKFAITKFLLRNEIEPNFMFSYQNLIRKTLTFQ